MNDGEWKDLSAVMDDLSDRLQASEKSAQRERSRCQMLEAELATLRQDLEDEKADGARVLDIARVEITKLHEQLAASQKDAARYRYYRERNPEIDKFDCPVVCAEMHDTCILFGDELDSKTDLAIVRCSHRD